MNAVLDHFDAFTAALDRNRLFGAYPAQVIDIKDPDGQGRVKVKLPWSPDTDDGSYQVWARLALLMAGNNRGSWFIPDPNDEVLVVFEGGDPRRPYVVGMLWNGKDKPPETMDGSGNNFKKTIRSRNGVKITIDDTDGSESITLTTPAGQTVTLKDGPGSIELQDTNGNDIKTDTSGVTIVAGTAVTVRCATTLTVNALGVTINAADSTFSGVVHANAFITPSIVGGSYTPGAGNIW
jgi:uncharacterized protein involved in type VI secretion and phage assembly